MSVVSAVYTVSNFEKKKTKSDLNFM